LLQQPRDRIALYALAAALAAVLTSVPMLGNGVSLPDQVLIDDSLYLRQPIGPLASFVPRLASALPPDAEVNPEYPAPLSRLLWWLEFRLWSSHSLGYQITSIILYALGIGLACLAIARLFGSPALGLLGALIIAFHPATLPATLVRYQGALLAAILACGTVLALRSTRLRRSAAFMLALAAPFTGPPGMVAGAAALAVAATHRNQAIKRTGLQAGAASFAIVALWALAAPYLRGPTPQVGTSGEPAPPTGFLSGALAAGGLQLFHALLPLPLILERAPAPTALAAAGLALWFAAAVVALVWLARRKRETLLSSAWILAAALLPVLEALGRRQSVGTSPSSTYLVVCGAALLVAALFPRSQAEPHKKRKACPSRLRVALILVPLLLLAALRLWYASAWGDDLRMINRALALSPSNPEYACERGWALLARGHAQAALKDFVAACNRHPAYPRAQCGLGTASVLWEAGLPQYGEALVREGITTLQQAASHDPNYALPLVRLARTFAKEGRPQPALEAARRAVKGAPDLPDADAALGEALLWQGAFPEAIAALRRALRRQPDLVTAQAALVSASDPLAASQAPYLQNSDLAQSAEPGWSPPERLLLRGNAFIWRLKPGEAIAAYDRALEYRPPPDLTAMVQLNRAFAYEFIGQFDRARAALAAVEPLDCDPQWKQAAVARMNRLNAYLKQAQR